MSAVHLGTFGTPRQAAEQTFGWFGATVRTNPDTSPELELTEFMNKAAQISLLMGGGEVDVNDPQAVAEVLPQAVGAMDTVVGFLQVLIHPDDWPEFYRLAKTNRQTIEDLMGVAMALVEAASAVPSGRPSGSSAGRSRTKRRSRAGSSSPVTPALRLVRGRPDLQVAIITAEQARQAGLRDSA